MNPRFPSIDAIRNNLSVDPYGESYYPAMCGAVSGLYSIATSEFEELRRLAEASINGKAETKEDLRAYLRTTDGIAELYQAEGQVTKLKLETSEVKHGELCT